MEPRTKRVYKIGDKEPPLGALEHSILRQNETNTRIHFAINCASGYVLNY